MKENRSEILHGRTTENTKTAVVQYAKEHKITVSKAVEKLIKIALGGK